MGNTAKKIDSLQPAMEYCLVVGAEEGAWTVASDNGLYKARTAVSCLVKPEKRDIVLVSVDHEEGCYILAILLRPDSGKSATTLSLDGKVNIEVPNGALGIRARDGITFTTPERIAMTSEDLAIIALKGEARIENLSFLGRLFSSRIEKIRLIADTFDSVCRRVVQKLVSSYRYVEGHDEIQSGSTRMVIDGTFAVQSKNAVHVAEEHVKIDAEQIHLG